MTTTIPTTPTGIAERPTAITARLGPVAFVSSGALALAVTTAAATFAPDLVEPGTGGYALSGIVMTLSDLALLIGVISLAGTDAVRRGVLRSIGVGLAVLGSVGILPAEIALRVNHDAGNASFKSSDRCKPSA